MKKEKTARGFDIIYFTDKNGRECSLQKSSSAMEDCIWLGANKIELKEFGKDGWIERPEFDNPIPPAHFNANTRMHLTQDQVKELLPALMHFARTGNVSKPLLMHWSLRLILRIIVFPFVFGIVMITYILSGLKRSYRFLKWGGEWINYDKEESITIQMIYEKLRLSKVDVSNPQNAQDEK